MLKVFDLRTEYLEDPIGLDAAQPRFSWKLDSSRQNVIQTARRIVAFSAGALLWDSGTVAGSESQRVRYEGPALLSRQQVEWRVTVTAGEETAESGTAHFEMGLLSSSDWRAKWIEPERDVDFDARKPAPYLRREFFVKSGLDHARIYQTAHGLYEFWINGVTGTDDKFKPGLTSYYSRIQYQTYDVTKQLHEGQNSWAVVLGDGWWRGVTGGTLKNNFGYKLHFLGQLELVYQDGSTEIIGTDEHFKTAFGGLLGSDMQMGEVYDARLEPAGWKLPGFDGSTWTNVHLAQDSFDAALIPSRSVPVRERERFDCRVLRDANDDLVLDFGQNVAGWVRMRLRSCQPGQKIRLTHGEELKDGLFSIDHINKSVLPLEAFQEVTYICIGNEMEEYCPLFSVFGFRYVKVEGYKGPIQPGDFVSVAVYSAMPETGSFTCSNPLINKLAANSLWSQKGNFLDAATDCPTRERNAWTGDNQVYVRTAADFMNVYTFYEKWLQDLSLEQYASGKIGLTFPSTSSCHNEQEFERKGTPMAALAGPKGDGNMAESSAGWGDAAVWLPYMIYLCYGDEQILKNQYPTARRWTDHMLSRAKAHNPVYENQPQYHNSTDGELDADYIYDTGFHFGEWLEPVEQDDNTPLDERMRNAFIFGNPLVATAYMCRSCDAVAHMARILGYDADARAYAAYAERIRYVYDRYLIAADGTIVPGRQAPYVRVLAMNLCAPERRGQIAARLAEAVEKNGCRLNTGFLSTPFLLPVLAGAGCAELAFRVLEQTECPGWLHPITLGSTTIPESWDALDRHEGSYNHYSYGAVCDFLFSQIAGIQPVFDTPGYRHFELRPLPGGTLTQAEAVYESLYGTIRSGWTVNGEKMVFHFTIPANTTAAVFLPGGRREELGSGSYEFSTFVLTRLGS